MKTLLKEQIKWTFIKFSNNMEDSSLHKSIDQLTHSYEMLQTVVILLTKWSARGKISSLTDTTAKKNTT